MYKKKNIYIYGQIIVTSYKKGLKKCFFENLGERPIEMY